MNNLYSNLIINLDQFRNIPLKQIIISLVMALFLGTLSGFLLVAFKSGLPSKKSKNNSGDYLLGSVMGAIITIMLFIGVSFVSYDDYFFSPDKSFNTTLLIEDSYLLEPSVSKDRQTIYINVKNKMLAQKNENETYQKISNATGYGYATIAKINPYTQTIESCNEYGDSFVEAIKEAYESDEPNQYRIISNQESVESNKSVLGKK